MIIRLTITANNIHGNLKEIKRASQIPEGDRRKKTKARLPLVPIEKITSTHKKQENNLVKRIRMLTIGRGLGLCIGLVTEEDIDRWLIQ
jgi:hypothetical protein